MKTSISTAPINSVAKEGTSSEEKRMKESWFREKSAASLSIVDKVINRVSQRNVIIFPKKKYTLMLRNKDPIKPLTSPKNDSELISQSYRKLKLVRNR